MFLGKQCLGQMLCKQNASEAVSTVKVLFSPFFILYKILLCTMAFGCIVFLINARVLFCCYRKESHLFVTAGQHRTWQPIKRQTTWTHIQSEEAEEKRGVVWESVWYQRCKLGCSRQKGVITYGSLLQPESGWVRVCNRIITHISPTLTPLMRTWRIIHT